MTFASSHTKVIFDGCALFLSGECVSSTVTKSHIWKLLPIIHRMQSACKGNKVRTSVAGGAQYNLLILPQYTFFVFILGRRWMVDKVATPLNTLLTPVPAVSRHTHTIKEVED